MTRAHLLTALERHDHQHIDAGLQIGLAAPKHFIDTSADGGPGIGASDDDHVGIEAVALGHGRAVLADGLGDRDHLDARREAAALREDLILQEEAGNAGRDELVHGPRRVDDVPEPRLTVRDHRDRDGLADAPEVVDRFRQRHQAGVRQAEDRRGGLRARVEEEPEAGRLCQLGMMGRCAGDRADRVGLFS